MKTTRKVIFSALLAALVCVATMLIKLPSPLNGYINLGDCFVLLAAWLLPMPYGLCAAGIGSALADLFSGYALYAPATFVIKALMAVTARGIFLLFSKKERRFGRLLGGVLAELVMVLGYYVFEGVLYGFVPSLVNIPANGVQAAAGVIFGLLLIKLLEKQNLTTIFE